MSKLVEGDKAPDFTLPNQNSENITLSNFLGSKVVLFFYPKDNTPGCTAEACDLNENYERFVKKGYKIIGISPDSVASHEKFAGKYKLSYDILADTEKVALSAYGVWVQKKMFGREYMGVARTTFIIDENGIIEKIYKKVNTKNHSEQILG